eukprot:g32186.t1
MSLLPPSLTRRSSQSSEEADLLAWKKLYGCPDVGESSPSSPPARTISPEPPRQAKAASPRVEVPTQRSEAGVDVPKAPPIEPAPAEPGPEPAAAQPVEAQKESPPEGNARRT